MEVENENILEINNLENKPRKVIRSALVEFLEDPRVFLEESNVDLAKVQKIQFFFKYIQAIDTPRRLMVFQPPTAISMICVTTDVWNLCESCEREWLRSHPHL